MLFTFSNAEERGILLTISCLAHGRGFLCIEWLIRARRFLAAKHSRLGKLAVLGTPKAAKCARLGKLAVLGTPGAAKCARL